MQATPKPRMDFSPTQKDGDVDPEDEGQRTLFCANLSELVTEEILYELFIQSGPVESVTIPKDKDGRPRQFAFVTFVHGCSVLYAIELYNGVRLFNRDLVVRFRNQNQNPRNQVLGKRRLIDSNSLPDDNSPPSNRSRPWRDEPREPKRRYSPERSSLRMGGQGGSNSRIDMSLQPRSPSKRGGPHAPEERNQFQVNDLERLGTNFMVNAMKGAKTLFEDAIKNALSNDSSRRSHFDVDRSGNQSYQGRQTHSNPFREMAPRGFSDQSRGRGNGGRDRNRDQRKHR